MLDFLNQYGLYIALAVALLTLAALLWYSVGARKALLDLFGMAHAALKAAHPLDEAGATALIGVLFDEGTLFVPFWLRVLFPKSMIVPALVHLVLDLEGITPAPSPVPAP